MAQSTQDIFYEGLAPAENIQATTKWLFSLIPIPTFSIFRRKNGTSSSPTDTSLQTGRDFPINGVIFSNTGPAAPPLLSKRSSVVAIPTDHHMTNLELFSSQETLPSTPPQRSHLQYRYYEGYNQHEGSPTSSTPPFSPSSTRSTSSASTTSTSLSEPPTPARNNNIDACVYSTSPQSQTSFIPTKLNDFGALLADEASGWNGSHISSPQESTILSLEPIRKKSSISKPAKKQKQKQKPKYTSKAYRGPKPILETGPFIFEGLHLVQYPESNNIIDPDILEAGHIIGYGSRPKQATALQIARERRLIMRNKARHYGIDDEVKTVKSSGSVSRESSSSEAESRKGEQDLDLDLCARSCSVRK
ncbi:hypothetical protein VTL71DRAFT_474 [Oculimacula yallundae]|uniref:Uncharacterized protein n=1 Tax=Oculimacula yallundae TaxID=86028 RepID=A0ABR4D197_9HELO